MLSEASRELPVVRFRFGPFFSAFPAGILVALVLLFLSALPASAQDGTRVWPPDAAPPSIVEPLPLTTIDETAAPLVSDASPLAPYASWTRIVFVSLRHGTPDIYLMRGDGSRVQRVTTSAAAEARPVLHPDGARIAFDADYDGDGRREIWMIKTDGTGLQRLTFSAGDDYGAAFSSDYTQMAYTSNRDGNSEIYVLRLDTGAHLRVTNNRVPDFDPQWNPQWNFLAFVRAVDVMNGELAFARYDAHAGAFNEVATHGSVLRSLFLSQPRFNATGNLIAISSDSIWPSGNPDGALDLTDHDINESAHVTGGRVLAVGAVGIDQYSAGYVPDVAHFDKVNIPLISTRHYSEVDDEWYLTQASIHAVGAFGSAPLAAGGIDIASNWVSIDKTPPSVAIQSAPTYIPVTGLRPLRFPAVDDGSGVDAYEVSQLSEGSTSWSRSIIRVGYANVASYGALHVIIRARDRAGNWSEPTPMRTFYTYQHYLTGMLMDVRGYALTNALINMRDTIHNSGGHDWVTTTDSAGAYRIRASSGLRLHSIRPYLIGFEPIEAFRPLRAGTAPAEQHPDIPNTRANIVYAAQNQLLPNGGFESTENPASSWRLLHGAQVIEDEYLWNPTLAYDGFHALELPSADAAIQFTVTIAPDLHKPTLSLLWKADDVTVPVEFRAEISASSMPVTVTVILSNSMITREETYDWQLAWLDLEAYAGEQITITLQADHAMATRILVDVIRLSPWTTPIIHSLESAAAADVPTAADAEAASVTIQGENFMQPVQLRYGTAILRPLAVTWVDANTLRYTPPAALARGIYRLQVINNANTDAEVYGELGGGLRVGRQVYLPYMSMR